MVPAVKTVGPHSGGRHRKLLPYFRHLMKDGDCGFGFYALDTHDHITVLEAYLYTIYATIGI